tara:strand:- start:720 stop:1199 length:480 start_codon:yes stop_codon:yes gene_type:complete
MYTNSDYTCSENLNRINDEIYRRNIPSDTLPAAFSPRPVCERYTLLPIVRGPSQESFTSSTIFEPSQTFNPGNTTAPWKGYVHNINTETFLRNQVFPKSKFSNKGAWVPESNNLSLYDSPANKKATLADDSSFNKNIGYMIFNNSTRTQLSNIDVKTTP